MIAIDGAKITIMPKHDDLKDPLEFQSNELKKYFRQVLILQEIFVCAVL